MVEALIDLLLSVIKKRFPSKEPRCQLWLPFLQENDKIALGLFKRIGWKVDRYIDRYIDR